jgi:hypothetical protein
VSRRHGATIHGRQGGPGPLLGKIEVRSAYGAARSLIVVIVRVYYSEMIFYWGRIHPRALAPASNLPHSSGFFLIGNRARVP